MKIKDIINQIKKFDHIPEEEVDQLIEHLYKFSKKNKVINCVQPIEDFTNVEDLYIILGISNKATFDEIKKAYFTKAKIHHPDQGGHRKNFEKLNEAYIILSNKTSRDKYDATGEKETEVDLEGEARKELIGIYGAVLDKYQSHGRLNDLFTQDLKQIIYKAIVDARNAITKESLNCGITIASLKKLREKFDGDLKDMCVYVIDRKIEEQVKAKGKADRMTKIGFLMEAILEGFIFNFEEIKEEESQPTSDWHKRALEQAMKNDKTGFFSNGGTY